MISDPKVAMTSTRYYQGSGPPIFNQKLFLIPKIVLFNHNPQTIFISKPDILILIIVFEKQFAKTIFFSKGANMFD